MLQAIRVLMPCGARRAHAASPRRLVRSLLAITSHFDLFIPTRKKGKSLGLFFSVLLFSVLFFLFCFFNLDPMHTALPPGGEGRSVVGVASASLIGTRFQRWDPILC
jgi:hypothetical protein